MLFLVVKPQYSLMDCLENSVERGRFGTINNVSGFISHDGRSENDQWNSAGSQKVNVFV